MERLNDGNISNVGVKDCKKGCALYRIRTWCGDMCGTPEISEERSMMRGYKWGLLLVVLPYWAPAAGAEPAASGVAASQRQLYPLPASGVESTQSPEEDYQAALKADGAGNMVDAGRLYLRAAKGGHAAAQVIVAIGLRYASADKEAVEWFRKSAEQGNALGQLGLSTMYALGEGGLKQDFAEARKWVTRAADQGNKQAIGIMADAYINGKLGIDENARNSPDALAWIKRAADVDDVPALKALAGAYRSGQYGLAADPKQADALDAKVRKLLGIVEQKKRKMR